jgi:hypothetical protein
MGVCGYSWAEEPTTGDFGGEVVVDFFGFLKNLERDLFGGGCCGREDGEPLEVAGEGKGGRVVEVEDDCVGRASVSGEIGCEKGMNSRTRGESDSDRGEICSLGGGRGRDGEPSTTEEGMVGGN